MKVFDMKQRMREESAGKAEKLDEMLTQYGVDHFFALPSEDDWEVDETVELVVYYDSEQEMLYDLVVALFCKIELNRSDEVIKKLLKKAAA